MYVNSMMTTFIITDFDVFTIPVTQHTQTFSSLEHHIDWFCTTYPLLSSFRESMSWSVKEGEESRVYLQTRMEGFTTIRVSNSLNEHEFYLPKLKTYQHLTELFKLLLPVDTIRFRINHEGTLWELQNYSIDIHPSCHHIQLYCTEDDFYMVLDLEPSDWMNPELT
jgi:CYTH domain-containing protein